MNVAELCYGFTASGMVNMCMVEISAHWKENFSLTEFLVDIPLHSYSQHRQHPPCWPDP
jgi:hypothetical protein